MEDGEGQRVFAKLVLCSRAGHNAITVEQRGIRKGNASARVRARDRSGARDPRDTRFNRVTSLLRSEFCYPGSAEETYVPGLQRNLIVRGDETNLACLRAMEFRFNPLRVARAEYTFRRAGVFREITRFVGCWLCSRWDWCYWREVEWGFLHDRFLTGRLSISGLRGVKGKLNEYWEVVAGIM